ncbi:hypothetical protein A471_11538 [Ectopseudomonas mendocina DLHK]|nr:hypothetical protein A471_11538 [Pseudomonas mendocina DLHK]
MRSRLLPMSVYARLSGQNPRIHSPLCELRPFTTEVEPKLIYEPWLIIHHELRGNMYYWVMFAMEMLANLFQ